jgi:internalin A
MCSTTGKPKGLPRLEQLVLFSTGITDAGLEHVEGLARLRLLNLWNTKVSDAGLERIKMELTHAGLLNDGAVLHGPGLPNIKGRNTE